MDRGAYGERTKPIVRHATAPFTYSLVFLLMVLCLCPRICSGEQIHGAAHAAVSFPESDRDPIDPSRIEEIKGYILACSGVLWEGNLLDFDHLAGCKPHEGKIEKQKKGLSEWWNIESRDDLYQTLSWIEAGGHRRGFLQDVSSVCDMNEPDLIQFLRSFEETGFSRAHDFYIAWKYGRALGNKSLTGWDYCRYLILCRLGYLCGYIDEYTAWKLMIPAARILQRTFDSWEELGNNYLIGRQYWSLKQTRANGYLYEDAYRRLLDLPFSPWNRYPWNLDLSGAEQILKSTNHMYLTPIASEDSETAWLSPQESYSLEPAPTEAAAHQASDFSAGGRVHVVPDDYPLIQHAVDAAQKGDTIFIREGIYPECLYLHRKEALRITGCRQDQVVLRPAGPDKDFALRIHQSKQIILSDLTVEPETGPEPKKGINGVCVSESTVDILRCRIARSAKSGIVYFQGAKGTIRDCLVEKHGEDGIFADSQDTFVTIQNSRIIENQRFGILVARGARATVQKNLCLSNGQAGISANEPGTLIECRDNYVAKNTTHGISIHSGASGHLEGNVCENNRADGIKISRNCRNVTVKNNQCLKNGNAGITLHEQVRATIEDCLCLENQSAGIQALGAGVEAVLRGNRCIANKTRGILFAEGAWGLIDRCLCERNGESGLAIYNHQTQVTVTNSQSNRNGKHGIIFADSGESIIEGNLCKHNKQSGIYIQTASSKTQIKNNHCHSNWEDGIFVWDCEAEVKENMCRQNIESGIKVFGDRSDVLITGNEVISNGGGGIAIESLKKAAIEKNLCVGNRGYGIRNYKSGGSVRLIENLCRENYPTGILFVNGAGGYARGNLCERNGWAGIAIRGEQTSPVIEANTCTGNLWGIILWDHAIAGWGTDNRTSGNTGAGTKIR